MTTGIAVCVPARDESRALPRLLAALAAQTVTEGVTLCLYLDGPDSAAAALLQSRPLPFPLRFDTGPRAAAPSAGAARRAAMTIGLATAPALLLSTDADSMPAADWIARMADALAVAEVVAGRITRNRADPRQDRIEAYLDRLHSFRRTLDPVPWEPARTHHCTGGANLGFRAAAYRALDGFAALPAGEDARIVEDAGRAGLRVRRDTEVVVRTSSRRRGRAPDGLAAHLARLGRGEAAAPLTAHPADEAWRWRMQARARACFDGTDGWAPLAAGLHLAPDRLAVIARACPNAEAFAMRAVPARPGGVRQIPLAEAERQLARLEGDLALAAA